MLAVLRTRFRVLTQEEPLQPLLSQAGIPVTAFPSYLGAVSPASSALGLAHSCFGNLPARPASPSCPGLHTLPC